MKTSLVVVSLVILIALLSGLFLLPKKTTAPTPTVTPTSTNDSSPLTPSPTSGSITLQTIYISAVDWPPHVSIENITFSCTEAGSQTGRAGETKKIIIHTHTYCVTTSTEGAAGSIYTQYAYARAKGDKTQILTFSLRFVQCGNYPEEEKTACESERSTFSIDTLIDSYFQQL